MIVDATTPYATIAEISRLATHNAQHKNRDLEVGIHDQRIAVLLKIAFGRAGNFRGGFRLFVHLFYAHH